MNKYKLAVYLKEDMFIVNNNNIEVDSGLQSTYLGARYNDAKQDGYIQFESNNAFILIPFDKILALKLEEIE